MKFSILRERITTIIFNVFCFMSALGDIICQSSTEWVTIKKLLLQQKFNQVLSFATFEQIQSIFYLFHEHIFSHISWSSSLRGDWTTSIPSTSSMNFASCEQMDNIILLIIKLIKHAKCYF